MTARDAAARITEVVNSNMARALRIVSVERGHDPREFSLIAFGGAGPVHAVALVQELPIPEVIIPPAPGAFSALGLVATDLKRDYAQTLYADLGSVDPSWVAATYAGMERAGAAMLEAAVAPAERQSLPRFADVRYPRQADELTLPVADGPVTRESLDRLAAAFHDKHEQTYGHANRGEAVQLVTLRLTALGKARGSEAVPAIRPRYRAGPDARHLVRRDWLRSGSGALEKRPDCRDNRDRAGRHRGLRLHDRHPARLDELGYLRMTRA